VAEERLKLAVFIDFDNIQIGVKETLGKEFDVSVVLEALKERGEVVTKVAYGDWPRAGEQSRQMTQHAVQMVQRNLTPRGDKNGADINLALDALEMAFTRDHINAFVIVGGDSDFIALVEKLKQYDKRVFVVGGRQFTSGILQRNCHEFIAYENLLKGAAGGDGSRAARSPRSSGRAVTETRPLSSALPNLHRALKILAEREVAPQLGLLKSTLLQLDPTFSERDYGAGSFLEFIQKLKKARLAQLRKTERGYLVESAGPQAGKEPSGDVLESVSESPLAAEPGEAQALPASSEAAPVTSASTTDFLAILKQALAGHAEKAPNRPLYLRQVRQVLRPVDARFEDRSAGFRGLLDLLHQAQREGWLRLHRDRKGVWRIFAIPPGPVGVPTAPEPLAEAAPIVAAEPAPVAPEPAPETAPLAPEEVAVAEPALAEALPLVIEEAAPVAVSPERKVRKPRAARASRNSGQRKASSRRRAKQPLES
jgi:uncharacterized LabA/DUF88 family protein